jgi:hypothetical protein
MSRKNGNGASIVRHPWESKQKSTDVGCGGGARTGSNEATLQFVESQCVTLLLARLIWAPLDSAESVLVAALYI